MADEKDIGTELSGAAPDVVRAAVLIARYAKAKIVPFVLSLDTDVIKGRGDRVSVTVMPSMTVQDVGTGGGLTADTASITSVELIVNKWKHLYVRIEDKSELQTITNFAEAFAAEMGRALAAQQDTDLASEHSNITGQTGVGGAQPLDDSVCRAARRQLDEDDIPEDDRAWILHPFAEADLLALSRFSEAQATGFSRGLQVENGRLSGLYGHPVKMTSRVQTSSNQLKNLLLHKECLAIATQSNFKIVKLGKTQLSDDFVGHVLYGVKTIRSNHGVVLSSAST